MPTATAAATASLLVSTNYGEALLTRFFAMGNPMVPTPIKPIRIMTRLLWAEWIRGENRGRRAVRRPLLCVSYAPGACASVSVHRARGDLVGHHRRDDDGARADADLGPLLVGSARLAVAAPCLIVMAAAASRLRARPGPPPLVPSDAAAYALLGLAMAAYQVCYFRAVTLTGVAMTRSSPSARPRS